MQIADVRLFYRSVRGSIGAAAILLTLDVVLFGSRLYSFIFCPIWMLVSLLRSATKRPGWGLAVVRIFIPFLTLWIGRVNDAFQLSVAEANAQRIITACEDYHAGNGRFPTKLDELVPRYLDSVPVARYCLGPSSLFYYSSSPESAMLWWQVVPPHYRKIYKFETRSWFYLD